MNLHEKLMNVQAELVCPKSLENKFGNYKYRSAEGIMESVKPLLLKHRLAMTVNDEIIKLDGVEDSRFYVKSTVTIIDIDKPEDVIINTAYAREDDVFKGMSSAQTTGAVSSYARKYALNGMFLIDDSKDPDTDEFHKQTGGGKVFNRQEMIDTINAMPEDERQKILDEYAKRNGKPISDARFIKTDFLKEIFNRM